MWKGILPVGSVVLLKESTRKLMISGYCMQRESDHKIFDYSGVLYPDGFEDIQNMYLFDRDQIERVYYVGYFDEKTEKIIPSVEESIRELRGQ